MELAARRVAQVLPPPQRERLGGLADVHTTGRLLPHLVDHGGGPAFVYQAEFLHLAEPSDLLADLCAVVMAGRFGVRIVVLVDQLEHRAALFAGGILEGAGLSMEKPPALALFGVVRLVEVVQQVFSGLRFDQFRAADMQNSRGAVWLLVDLVDDAVANRHVVTSGWRRPP